MRFNDYHKSICAALKLEKDEARELRSFMIRLHFRDISPNAAVALTKIEIERRAKVAAAAALPPGEQIREVIGATRRDAR